MAGISRLIGSGSRRSAALRSDQLMRSTRLPDRATSPFPLPLARNLPHDLTICILETLPVKPLLKCMIINHQWKSTITSHNFIKNHFSHKSSRTKLLICWNVTMLSEDKHAFTLFHDQSLTCRDDPMDFDLVGNFDGLYGPSYGVFLVTTKTKKMAVWNPSTRRLRTLPSTPWFDNEMDSIALSVDAISFKVLVIHGYAPFSDEDSKCVLYSSNANSWNVICNEVLEQFFVYRGNCGLVSIGGCFYWMMALRKTRMYSILEFDMPNEAFKEIQIPVRAQPHNEIEVATCQDKLALLQFKRKGGIDIWLRSGNSFLNTYKVDVSSRTLMHALGFWEQKLVYTKYTVDRGLEVVLYDIGLQRGTVLEIAETDVSKSSSYLVEMSIHHYKASLMSLKDEASQIEDFGIQSDGAREFFNA